MNDGWTIEGLTPYQKQAAEDAIKAAPGLVPGDTFFKSGDRCTVVGYNAAYNTLTYRWPDDETDYLLHLSPTNDEEFCDWSDVEIVGAS